MRAPCTPLGTSRITGVPPRSSPSVTQPPPAVLWPPVPAPPTSPPGQGSQAPQPLATRPTSHVCGLCGHVRHCTVADSQQHSNVLASKGGRASRWHGAKRCHVHRVGPCCMTLVPAWPVSSGSRISLSRCGGRAEPVSWLFTSACLTTPAPGQCSSQNQVDFPLQRAAARAGNAGPDI